MQHTSPAQTVTMLYVLLIYMAAAAFKIYWPLLSSTAACVNVMCVRVRVCVCVRVCVHLFV